MSNRVEHTSVAARELLLESLELPSMPEALQALQREQASAEPDMERLSEIIASDISLSAEVLKAVNSPAFGLSVPQSSIPNAVMMLGLDNVLNITTGIALRCSMNGGDCSRSDRFWDTASDVAQVSATLARRLTGVPADMAYTLGLFHDCGIPLLMARFVDYSATLKEESEQGCFTRLEGEHYGIDHTRVGYEVARRWELPTPIAQAIRLHHRYLDVLEQTDKVDELVPSLLSVLKLAEHISVCFRGLAFRNSKEDKEWELLKYAILDQLELDEDDLADIQEELLIQLGR